MQKTSAKGGGFHITAGAAGENVRSVGESGGFRCRVGVMAMGNIVFFRAGRVLQADFQQFLPDIRDDRGPAPKVPALDGVVKKHLLAGLIRKMTEAGRGAMAFAYAPHFGKAEMAQMIGEAFARNRLGAGRSVQ